MSRLGDLVQDSDPFMSIPVSEYEVLHARIKELERIISDNQNTDCTRIAQLEAERQSLFDQTKSLTAQIANLTRDLQKTKDAWKASKAKAKK